jgi:4-amino-4-deoxy-L-arabinose transferase-like glycosyltransferase
MDGVAALLRLLILFYLPGALLFRAPLGERDRRASLPADERAFWSVVLSLAWTITVALLLAAASTYRLSALLAINALACAALLACFRQRLRLSPEAPRPRAGVAVPMALAALVVWLAVPPAEYVMGGKDPGTYMSEGVQIAQRGSLVIVDQTVASVPAEARDLFFPSHQTPAYYGVRFMGFFIQDPAAGTVVGQFPHLFPVSIAIGYGLNGLSGARQTVIAWAALGVLAVFFASARLFGRTVAAGAAVLLALNVIHVWFARYPNAEMAMTALLFAALLAFARSSVDGDRSFAPLAAWLLGLLLFVRIDAGLAWAGVIGAGVLGWLAGRRLPWTFWVGLAAGATLAAWYYATLMTGYLAVPALFVRETVPVAWLGAAGGAALVGFRVLSRRERIARPLRTAVPWLLALALTALACYAFFVREAAGKTAWHDAEALRTFAWYVGPVGLALAVGGVVALVPRVFWRDPAFFLTAAAFATFFFYKIRIVPEHFWMTRRFLPVILPMWAVLVAAVTWWLATRLVRHRDDGQAARAGSGLAGSVPRWRQATAGVLMVAVLVALMNVPRQQVARILGHVEYAGVIARLEQLAGRFADNDLVIVESRNASDLHVLALPLAYIYAKAVLVLNSPRPDRAMMEAFIADARRRYREVFFLGSGGTDLLTRRIGVEPVGSDRFQVPEYESALNAYPAGVRRKEFDYGVYRFVDVSELARTPELVVGQRDDLQVVRFHAKEKDPASGRTFRWTRDVSYVSLLNVTASTRTITVWMADGRRPASLPRADVEVSLDDRVLGAVTVGPDVTAYDFAVPADLAAAAAAADAPARLRLRTSTWSPRTALGTPDDRALGVLVYRIRTQ